MGQRSTFRTLALAAVTAAPAGGALAQDGARPADAEPAPPIASPEGEGRGAPSFRFDLFGGYQFETDLDAAGSVSASRGGGQFDIVIPVGEHARLTLDLAAQATFYSFDGATNLAADGDPIGTAEYFGLSARYFHRFAERWGGYIGGGVSSSGEPGADFGDTLQYGGGFGVTYFFSESFSISPGLFVRSQIEESTVFVPMVNLDWRITEEWRLATIFRAAGIAPGLALSYSPSEAWTFTLAGSYENRSYRLDDDGPNPNGVFKDRRVPFDLSARWNGTPNFSIEATAGVSMFGEFKVRDADGDEVGADDLDPAPFLGVTLTFRF